MECPTLYKLYQRLPNPYSLLDKLLYSQPVIELFSGSTFEIKCLLVSYSISIGIFFDPRANMIFRKLLLLYFLGGGVLVWISCVFYFADLITYDIEAVTLGTIPLVLTSTRFVYQFSIYYLYGEIKQLIEFFIDDHNRDRADSEANGSINVKKWIIVSTWICIAYPIFANLFHSAENQTEAVSRFTTRPFVMKFFPIWCPFEEWWVRGVASVFQDFIVLPGFLIFFGANVAIFVSAIGMRNKYESLLEKLRSSSQRTFERIEMLDRSLEETMEISRESIRLRDIRVLEQEKAHTMASFHGHLISCVERFQQLQRIKLTLKKVLDYYFSMTYCSTLCILTGFGFVGVEALFNAKLEYDLISRMTAWFLVFGGLWFMNCGLGELFLSQDVSFADEVYFMPWYHFTPKQRKTVLTLMTVVQKPMRLRLLKLLDLTMETFPDFLNVVYSYVQIMRTLQQVKHRHM